MTWNLSETSVSVQCSSKGCVQEVPNLFSADTFRVFGRLLDLLV